MFTLMKILHLFGLMLGAGGGLGNMLLSIQAKRTEGPPPPAIPALRKRFAQVSLGGVVLLWLTGLWLWLVPYDAVTPGLAFSLKLVAAAIILGFGIVAQVAMARAQPGTPPPGFIRRFGPLVGLLAYVAVALAVIAFS